MFVGTKQWAYSSGFIGLSIIEAEKTWADCWELKYYINLAQQRGRNKIKALSRLPKIIFAKEMFVGTKQWAYSSGSIGLSIIEAEKTWADRWELKYHIKLAQQRGSNRIKALSRLLYKIFAKEMFVCTKQWANLQEPLDF